jgi:hypothetical protein
MRGSESYGLVAVVDAAAVAIWMVVSVTVISQCNALTMRQPQVAAAAQPAAA